MCAYPYNGGVIAVRGIVVNVDSQPLPASRGCRVFFFRTCCIRASDTTRSLRTAGLLVLAGPECQTAVSPTMAGQELLFYQQTGDESDGVRLVV